ncbi:MAG: hypothetical protein QM773_21365 [Hyphomonadaceae bacterium]
MRPVTLLGALAFLGIAACNSSAPANAPSGTTSIANSCIRPTDIEKQDIVSDREIQFTLRNGEIWSNKLQHACSGLKFEQGFSWEVSGNFVCSNMQTIRVQHSGTPCQLGEFTKLPEPPKT